MWVDIRSAAVQRYREQNPPARPRPRFDETAKEQVRRLVEKASEKQQQMAQRLAYQGQPPPGYRPVIDSDLAREARTLSEFVRGPRITGAFASREPGAAYLPPGVQTEAPFPLGQWNVEMGRTLAAPLRPVTSRVPGGRYVQPFAETALQPTSLLAMAVPVVGPASRLALPARLAANAALGGGTNVGLSALQGQTSPRELLLSGAIGAGGGVLLPEAPGMLRLAARAGRETRPATEAAGRWALTPRAAERGELRLPGGGTDWGKRLGQAAERGEVEVLPDPPLLSSFMTPDGQGYVATPTRAEHGRLMRALGYVESPGRLMTDQEAMAVERRMFDEGWTRVAREPNGIVYSLEGPAEGIQRAASRIAREQPLATIIWDESGGGGRFGKGVARDVGRGLESTTNGPPAAILRPAKEAPKPELPFPWMQPPEADPIQQAFEDWTSGLAYIDGRGNYHVKRPGSSSGPIAPWNRTVKDNYDTVTEFADAARGEAAAPLPVSETEQEAFAAREAADARRAEIEAQNPALAAPAAEGQPMFHGTASPDDLPTVRQGSYVTPDPEIARSYAEVDARIREAQGQAAGPPRVVEVQPAPGDLAPPPPESELAASRGAMVTTRDVPAGPPPGAPPPPTVPPAAAEPPPPGRYVAPLRPMADVAAEVVTSTNPVVRAVAGRTGINPSLLADRPIGRILTAYERQRISVDELTRVAVSSALDVHAQPFTGLRRTFQIDASGQIRNLAGAEGRSRMWYDVFSRPGDYTLTASQRAYIDDYLAVVREMEAQRVAAGLPALSKTGKDGWFYVPRQVKGVRGVEIRRPSSPKLQRVYEEAQEGAARGVKYETDPRAVLETHVRAAYNEILQKQLSDAVAPLSKAPRELIAKPVRERMEAAIKQRRTAERALRKNPKDPALKAALETAKDEYRVAKTAYSARMKAARKAEVSPGALWGPDQPETIAISAWRNRFFPREDADLLNERLGAFMRPGDRPSIPARVFNTTGNLMRLMSAGFDWGVSTIHGLPTFFRNPVVWSKATAGSLYHFFDPAAQAKYIRHNFDVMVRMAQYATTTQEPEVFAAIRAGGGFSPGRILQLLPRGEQARAVAQGVGRQTLGRFETQFGGFGLIVRTEMWKALRPGWKGSEADLWAYLRNMTGALDTRALGVTASQRGTESMWLAFSPRLLRSTTALISNLAKNPITSPAGREAWRTLASLTGGMSLMYVATGILMGKSREEITTGLNPTAGKKFLSYNINGDWVGIGGQFRAVAQLLGMTAAHPEGLAQRDTDNPLLQAYMARGAVGLRMGGAIVEGTTGEDVLPYDQVDSPIDIGKHLGTSMLPFALQGVLEGQQPLTDALNALGLRTSAGTVTEKKEQAGYYTMGRQEQIDFQANNPELFAEPSQLEGAARKSVELRQERTQRLADIQPLMTEQHDGKAWRDARAEIVANIAARRADLPEFAGGHEQAPEMAAYSRYLEIIDEARKAAPGQVLTGDLFDEADQRARAEIGPEASGLVDQAMQASADPVEREYLQDRQQIEDSGYWAVDDKLWSRAAAFGIDPKVAARYGSYYEWKAALRQRVLDRAMEQTDPVSAAAIADVAVSKVPAVRNFEKAANTIRGKLREAKPDLLRLLLKWGYKTPAQKDLRTLVTAR